MRVLRSRPTKDKTGLSQSQIKRKSADPEDDFPAPVRISNHCIGWREDELDEWIANRPRVTYGASEEDSDGEDGSEPENKQGAI